MVAFLLLLLLFLFAINTRVAFALTITAAAGMLLGTGVDLTTLPQRILGGMNSFILLAVPFFLLAGIVMNKGGITKRIFRFAQNLVGYIPGGLGHANIVAGIIMAGISGSAQADAAGLSKISIEGMTREGYGRAFSAAVIAAAATIGPVIPPSIILVVYGALTNASVGALLLAGIVPGVTMGLFFMIVTYIISKHRNYPVAPPPRISEVWVSFKEAVWALLTPVVLIGGMFGGTFTPTEAGAIAALYAIIVSRFVYRELHWKDVPQILTELVVANAGVMLIIGAAAPLGYVVAYEGLPQAIAELMLGISQTKWVILLLINVVLLIAGMFLEGIAILTIMVPLLQPLARSLGVDPVHFGIITVLNLMIGTVTPPVGVVSYIVASIANLSLGEFLRELWPFLLALLAALLLFTYIPELSLFIPKLLL